MCIRDVNSREIAFLGRESHFPGLDRDSRFLRVRTFYRRDQSWIASVSKMGGAIAGRSPTLFPADAGTPSIDRHRRRTRNFAKRRGRYGRSATGQAQWPIGPQAMRRWAGDTPLSFVSQHPCVLYAGHGHGKQSSDQFIASAERRDNYPAHNRPFLGGCYSLFYEVKKFLFRDREKRSRLETIESR